MAGLTTAGDTIFGFEDVRRIVERTAFTARVTTRARRRAGVGREAEETADLRRVRDADCAVALVVGRRRDAWARDDEDALRAIRPPLSPCWRLLYRVIRCQG